MNTDTSTKLDILIAMALAARSDIRDGADPDAVFDELRHLVLRLCLEANRRC